ncbi:MAG: hypothetical protein R3B45_08825 [Bdellovibrionota bacterium]
MIQAKLFSKKNRNEQLRLIINSDGVRILMLLAVLFIITSTMDLYARPIATVNMAYLNSYDATGKAVSVESWIDQNLVKISNEKGATTQQRMQDNLTVLWQSDVVPVAIVANSNELTMVELINSAKQEVLAANFQMQKEVDSETDNKKGKSDSDQIVPQSISSVQRVGNETVLAENDAPDAFVNANGLDLGLALQMPKNFTEIDSLLKDKPLRSAAISVSKHISSKPLTMGEVEKQALMNLDMYKKQSKSFAKEANEIGYSKVALQIMDERSVPSKGVIYPAVGVSVGLVGTDFVVKTNALGKVEIPNMPINSRFMVVVRDPSNVYVPTVAEFFVDMKGEAFATQIKVMRAFTLEMNLKVSGVELNRASESFCGTAFDHEGYVLSGISAEIDISADGPYYFNRFGYLDPSLKSTDINGRFCYFNVPSGPFSISFSSDSFFSTVPMNSFAGYHTEEDFYLLKDSKIFTHLAALATAHEQLSNDEVAANNYRPVDMINLIPLGEDEPLMQIDDGYVTNAYGLMPHMGRLFALSQAAEFEQTLYSYGVDDDFGVGSHVTPLLPRGFIEDMSIYANTVYDPALGTVVVEFGSLTGQGNSNIRFKLVDHEGNKIGNGWYYSDGSVNKAIFFNVGPGFYNITAESQEGYWLASDNIFIYNETLSYVRLGARTRFR